MLSFNFYTWKNLFCKKDIIFPLSENIIISKKIAIGNLRNIQVNKEAHLLIEDGVIIREFFNILVFKNAYLKVGKNVFFNNYCSINCVEKIIIGDNTLFGEGVRIYDHNHKYTFNTELEVEREKFNSSEVNIGKNCWIGSGVTILKGVTIGNNVIVGANNLIYKSIPENSIVKEKSELLVEHFG